MKRKIVITLLISLLLFLFSCTADTGNDMNNTVNNENSGELMQQNDEENDETQKKEELSDHLPDMDFEGYNFRILMHFEDEGWYAEEEIGEPLNDAVYLRNKIVEDRFNVNISLVEMPGWGPLGVKSILAGDDAFDILASHGIIAYQYVGRNVVSDWISNMPYNDLNAVWWNQTVVNEHSFFGKLYGVTGDISYSALHNTFCIYFNKNICLSL